MRQRRCQSGEHSLQRSTRCRQVFGWFRLNPMIGSDLLQQLTTNQMTPTDEIYTEAILFILDSISPVSFIELKDDLRLKLIRAYELQPSTIQGLKALERIMKASELSRKLTD